MISCTLNKRFAAHFGTTEKTAKIHRAWFLKKIGVTSVVALVHLREHAGLALAAELAVSRISDA